MQKIIFLKGLPASGKSTWAKQFCKENINFERLNKDDLREEFKELNPSGQWNKTFENQILEIQRKRGIDFINGGFSIIIDDTNFAEKHRTFWLEVAEKYGLQFEEKYFDTPVDVCVDRDKHREKSVGEGVIRDMYKRYVKHNISKTDTRYILKQNKSLPHCIIVDIDGTTSLMNGRNPYDDTLIYTDKPNQYLIDIVKRFKQIYNYEHVDTDGLINNKIIFMSGRMDKCRPQTEKWLRDNNVPFDKLFMRKTDDFRQDAVVKKELYDQHIKNKYYVEAWFDDRTQVIRMVREELGLLALQVYWGDF